MSLIAIEKKEVAIHARHIFLTVKFLFSRHIENGANGTMPSIRVVIVKGSEDVTIKVAGKYAHQCLCPCFTMSY